MQELLQKPVILGDGANGTHLGFLGFDREPYDLANVLAPDLVLTAHRAYLDAGSDFIETNTFGSNFLRLAGFNFDPVEINRRGAEIAREAAGEDRVVLGAMGPCGKPLAPIGSITEEQAANAFRAQALALQAGGVDAIILETFIDMDELMIAVHSVHQATGLPIFVSKAFIEDGEALMEGLPIRCAQEMAAEGVVAIGANCIVGPQRMVDIVRQIADTTDLPVLAMPTPGLPQLVKGKVVYDTAPEYFAEASMRLVEEGARIIGGCCGTTPEHIRHMRAAIDRGAVRKPVARASQRPESERKPLPESEPTELAQKLGRKFITTVEIDLPRGLNYGKVLQAAKQMKICGADMIDISDGARARLRMNPLSVSKLIQDDIGIEVMMHFACRDRNMLAVQADLLGSHALGVRNILCITGDPANIGDYPSATSVYDVDAIGLVRILNRFNEGVDLAGYSIGAKCAFTIAVAYNPLAQDMDLEIDRLKRKLDAGAHVVYTQPLFFREHVEQTLEVLEPTGTPLFVGVLPLKNTRHAEFMHNEVPGITVPDALRKRMADAPDDEAALKIGIESAQELSVMVRKTSQGLYLMPPFGSAAIAEQILEVVR